MAETFEVLQRRMESTLKGFWFGIMLPVVALVGFALLHMSQGGVSPFSVTFVIIAVILGVGGSQTRKRLLSEQRLRIHLAKPLSVFFVPIHLQLHPLWKEAGALSEQQKQLLVIPRWMLGPLILNWIFNVVVGIIGVYLLIGGDTQGGLSIIGIAAVLHILSYPRFEEYYAMAKRLMPEPS